MLFCYNCAKYTKSVGPAFIRKPDPFKLHVRALCEDCGWVKAQYISEEVMQLRPDFFKKIPLRLNFMKYLVTKTEKIELFPILEPILNS